MCSAVDPRSNCIARTRLAILRRVGTAIEATGRRCRWYCWGVKVSIERIVRVASLEEADSLDFADLQETTAERTPRGRRAAPPSVVPRLCT